MAALTVSVGLLDDDMSVSVSNGGSVWRDSMRSNLRRRHAAGDDTSVLNNSGEVEASIGIRTLRAVDIYAKVDQDLQLKTEAGAAVTIGFWVLMLVLIIGEVRAFMKEQPAIERVVVDSTMGQRLRINADITFHSIPCLDVHVDAMDVAGENQLDIDHDMLKQRLGPDGVAMGEPFAEVPGEGDSSLELPEGYCGSCYGAKTGCCNTCRDVTDAYTHLGWTLRDIRRTAEQCIRDNHMENPLVEGEGCRLSGFMRVNKVSGNFHVAVGEGVMREGRHIHLYNYDDAMTFNTSHTIHDLSFGEPFSGMRPTNPLDGTSRIIDEDVGTGLFQYFVKLVPTVQWVEPHIDGRASEKAPSSSNSPESEKPATLTSQFSYTYKFRSLKGETDYHMEQVDGDHPLHHATHGQENDDSKSSGRPTHLVLPGVFFVYDVSPFMVEIIPAPRTPLSHLLIRLCAVAGGAFAVSGIVDSVVFHVSNRLRRHSHSLLGR